MKKYIIFAAAALCIAAVSNAQASQKQYRTNSNNPAMAAHSVSMAKPIHTPTNVSPVTNSSQQTTKTAIKRKHHKKTVHPKKMVDKK